MKFWVLSKALALLAITFARVTPEMKLALALLSVVTLAAAQGEEGGCPLGEGCENMACQADITGLAGTPDGIVNVDMLVVLANFKCYTQTQISVTVPICLVKTTAQMEWLTYSILCSF